jgi:hypothetical protein
VPMARHKTPAIHADFESIALPGVTNVTILAPAISRTLAL